MDGPAHGRSERDRERWSGAAAEAVVRPVEEQAADQRGFPPVGDRPFDQELERVRGEVGRENHADGGLAIQPLALERFEPIESGLERVDVGVGRVGFVEPAVAGELDDGVEVLPVADEEDGDGGRRAQTETVDARARW